MKAALGILAALIIPGSALGQDVEEPPPGEQPEQPPEDPVARARELFAQGVACTEQHETACAERAFREALALHDAPSIRYNLASALFELGRYPESARLTASVLANSETPEDIRGPAEILQQQLQSRGGTLQITVAGAEGAEVRVDAEPIPDAQLGAVIVPPGTRTVTLVRGEEELAREEVDVAAGATVPVELAVIAPVEEPPAPPPSSEPSLVEDWRFWAGVGGGVALLVVLAVVIAAVASNPSVEAPIAGNFDPGVLRWE